MSTALISPEKIESKIYLIRGKKVMLGSTLSELYEVKTKAYYKLLNATKIDSQKILCSS